MGADKTTARARTLSKRLNKPVMAGTVGAALCATFTVGGAHATALAFDIPDVTLGEVEFVLNLDGDAFPDYGFQRIGAGPFFQNHITTLGINQVVGFELGLPTGGKPGTYASAMAAGELIHGGLGWVSGSEVFLSGKGSDEFGLFSNPGLAFIGLQFDIPDSTPHFGWVSAVTSGSNITLTCYGYETEANTGINAGAGQGIPDPSVCGTAVPEPGSLALLIAGAAGVLALRRRQRATR